MDLNDKAGLQIELSSEPDEDSSSHIDKSSTTGDGEYAQGFTKSASDEHIAGGETKVVNRSKWVVYFVIILAAIGIGASAYTFTKKSEESNLKAEVRKNHNVISRPFPTMY
jgi:hypothetical protein